MLADRGWNQVGPGVEIIRAVTLPHFPHLRPWAQAYSKSSYLTATKKYFFHINFTKRFMSSVMSTKTAQVKNHQFLVNGSLNVLRIRDSNQAYNSKVL